MSKFNSIKMLAKDELFAIAGGDYKEYFYGYWNDFTSFASSTAEQGMDTFNSFDETAQKVIISLGIITLFNAAMWFRSSRRLSLVTSNYLGAQKVSKEATQKLEEKGVNPF